MFGSSVEHIRGAFDSKEEMSVAKTIIEMQREKYVSGVLPHPKVSGVTADFLVQLGPETSDQGQLVLVEYDGLGINRPRGLGKKRQRYLRLSRNGLPARWLTDPSREAVKELITDYSPPHFAIRKDVCECGKTEIHVVIAPEISAGEVTRDALCTDCESNASESSNLQ